MISPGTTPSARVTGRRVAGCDPNPDTRFALERFAATRDSRLRDELLGRYDRVVQWVVNREAREPAHVRRRYFDDWSQTRVASSLGISQMHVSRLEREGLQKLRTSRLRWG